MKRAGEIVCEENISNVTIYISPEEYEQFCRDAEEIFGLYCLDDMCFRGIPDLWFDGLALIQFIRNQLRPHPIMGYWFRPFHSAGLLGPKYSI